MAGKKGMKGSGGARPGAGRQKGKRVVPTEVRNNYLEAAQELAEEYGESVEKAGLRLLFKADVQDSVRVSALKEYTQVLSDKENKKSPITNNEPDTSGVLLILSKEEFDAYRKLEHLGDKLFNSRSKIILPESKPDPAKLIQKDGEIK